MTKQFLLPVHAVFSNAPMPQGASYNSLGRLSYFILSLFCLFWGLSLLNLAMYLIFSQLTLYFFIYEKFSTYTRFLAPQGRETHYVSPGFSTKLVRFVLRRFFLTYEVPGSTGPGDTLHITRVLHQTGELCFVTVLSVYTHHLYTPTTAATDSDKFQYIH